MGLNFYKSLRKLSANDGRFTRQGTPTPILPDFTNLQSQWATLNPTGVGSQAYAATVKTTAPACPAYTAGGWAVDPNAPLPTLGQAALSGMTTGVPTTIPHGSITVVPTNGYGSSEASTSSNPNLPYTGGSTSGTTISSTTRSASASSSATSKAAGVRARSNPVLVEEMTVLRSLMLLGGSVFCAMVWL